MYVDMILSGQKSVEIRNRKLKLQADSRLWIYSTLPMGCIQAVTEVHHTEVDIPSRIWQKYGDMIGITRDKFHEYVNGNKMISAISLKNIKKLPVDLSLYSLRRKVPWFHPPQFLKYMDESDPILQTIVYYSQQETLP